MSIEKRNRCMPELKLKMLRVNKIINDSLDMVFTTSALGYYNNAIGRKRVLRWKKMLDQKTTLQALTLGPMTLVFGGYMLGQNLHDIFAWGLIVWGILISILEGLKHQSKDEEQDERISKLEKKFSEFESGK